MGCQMSSFIAKGWSTREKTVTDNCFLDFKKLTTKTIGRLTGLDCAGPIFENCGPAGRNRFYLLVPDLFELNTSASLYEFDKDLIKLMPTMLNIFTQPLDRFLHCKGIKTVYMANHAKF